MDIKKDVLIIIPALNPNEKFIKYVDELLDKGFKGIVVINDGSSEEYKNIFDKLEEKQKVKVLVHEVNKGKGRALKTGFEYFLNLENINDYVGIITVDCDGQHRIEDVLKIKDKMNEEKENTLILGVRNFTNTDVPVRSSFGNRFSKMLFKILYGKEISDVNTGLRGFTKDIIGKMINVSGERYEYEANTLVEAVSKKINIIEIPIETIYIDNNKGSHFRPVIDSIKMILKYLDSFIKYAAVALVSVIIDVLLFKLFLGFLNIQVETTLIVISTVLARIISSVINFILNKKVSFKSDKKVKDTIFKFAALCVIQMFVSGFTVAGIYHLTKFPEVLIKIVVDTILFFINFMVQKRFIFN